MAHYEPLTGTIARYETAHGSRLLVGNCVLCKDKVVFPYENGIKVDERPESDKRKRVAMCSSNIGIVPTFCGDGG